MGSIRKVAIKGLLAILADTLGMDLQYEAIKGDVKGLVVKNLPGVQESTICIVQSLVDASCSVVAALVKVAGYLDLVVVVDGRVDEIMVFVLDGTNLSGVVFNKYGHWSRKGLITTISPHVVGVFERTFNATEWSQWSMPKQLLKEYLEGDVIHNKLKNLRLKYPPLTAGV